MSDRGDITWKDEQYLHEINRLEGDRDYWKRQAESGQAVTKGREGEYSTFHSMLQSTMELASKADADISKLQHTVYQLNESILSVTAANQRLQERLDRSRRLQPVDRDGRPITQAAANALMAQCDHLTQRLRDAEGRASSWKVRAEVTLVLFEEYLEKVKKGAA